MHPSKHQIDDDAVNDQPLKKMKLEFLVDDMPAAQHASTSSPSQKMKLEFLVHDMPSGQHAATLPQPIPSVHNGQDIPGNQDEQDHIDAALGRMHAAVGLSMLSRAPYQQVAAHINGFIDEDVDDAARVLQQMTSDNAHVSPMQLDDNVHYLPEVASTPQQPTYNRVEGALALLMLARGFADPNASGFDHFINEDTYNSNRTRQQSASEDDQVTISAQSSQAEPVPAIHPEEDSFLRGEGDDGLYHAPPGLDHDEVFHHHDQSWLNDLIPGTISRPEANLHDQANSRDAQDDEDDDVVTPARPKRGKNTKVAATPRSTRKSKQTDAADVDDWQPSPPPDDEDDRDFKAPAHVKRGSNTQVGLRRWSSRTKKTKVKEAPADVPLSSPVPTPVAAPLPSPPPTSRRGKAKKPPKATKASVIDYDEGLMPSDSNDYKFQYDSSSGSTAAQLDALLKIPARPKKFPLDLQNKDQMPLSYNQLHQKPKTGLAAELVAKMEKAHAKEVKGWDDAETEDEL